MLRNIEIYIGLETLSLGTHGLDLGLGLGPHGLGLGLGLEACGLGLGLEPCGLVNIPEYMTFINQM